MWDSPSSPLAVQHAYLIFDPGWQTGPSVMNPRSVALFWQGSISNDRKRIIALLFRDRSRHTLFCSLWELRHNLRITDGDHGTLCAHNSGKVTKYSFWFLDHSSFLFSSALIRLHDLDMLPRWKNKKVNEKGWYGVNGNLALKKHSPRKILGWKTSSVRQFARGRKRSCKLWTKEKKRDRATLNRTWRAIETNGLND